MKSIVETKREWWVFSTCLGARELMLHCGLTEALSVVEKPTKEEWSRAFTAPSEPYRWTDEDRVTFKWEAK